MKNFIFIFIQISGFLLLQNPIFAHQPFGIADKNQDSYIEVSDAKISHAFYGIFDKKGEHTRAAVSVNSLPLGVAVEVDAIFELN